VLSAFVIIGAMRSIEGLHAAAITPFD